MNYVIFSFVKICQISSFQSREWLLYIVIVILQHIMASTKRNDFHKILEKKKKKCIGVKNKLIYDKVVLVFVQSPFLGTFLNKSFLSKSFVISVFKLIACYMKNLVFWTNLIKTESLTMRNNFLGKIHVAYLKFQILVRVCKLDM